MERPREKKTVTAVAAGKRPPLQVGDMQEGSGEAAVLTPARKQEILRERARALSRGDARGGVQEETLRVVEFFLARERYAVEAMYVREVQRVRHLTPLPCTPSFVLGIMNVRGHILSVVDLGVFFDLPQEHGSERDTVVILRAADMELGVLTDGGVGARALPLKAIKPVSPGLSGVRREYLRGISEEQTILLDVERILADKRMIVGADEVEL